MPSYEYRCEPCEILFEELLLSRDEVKKYAKEHPCPECKESASRVLSRTNFQFKGVSEGDPSRVGNSGSHDLDYPSLDKAIGRSSNRKWKNYNTKFAARAKIRAELGTNALTRNPDGSVRATDEKVLDVRAKGLNTWKKAVEQNPE